MLHTIIFLIFTLFAITLIFLYWKWENSRSLGLLEQWATDYRYELVSAKRRDMTLFTPFWLAGKGQTVYRFEVKDFHGSFFSGYALCGGRYLGIWVKQVVIKWDKPSVKKTKRKVEKPKNA